MAQAKWNNAVQSREEQRRQKRLAVLMAGAKLFNDNGFERTSLDDIAKELSITKRTIYYYVQSKEEILFECNRLGVEFIDGVAEECRNSSAAPLKRVEKFIGQYIEWVASDLGACLVLTRGPSLSPENQAELRRSMVRLDGLFRDIIEEGLADGSIAPCDPSLASAALFGAMNWIPFWNRRDKPVPIEEITRQFVSTFILGFSPRT